VPGDRSGSAAVIDYANLLVVVLIAAASPVVVAVLRMPVPDVVVQIVAGVVVGPSLLGWAHVDEPVAVLAALGLAYLLFVSGLEIQVDRLRGLLLVRGLLGFGLSLALAAALAGIMRILDLIGDVPFVAVVLTTTSLGVVVALLASLGQTNTTFGQLTLLGSSLADVGSVVLLSLLFSAGSNTSGVRILLLGLFTVAVLAVTVAGRVAVMVAPLARLFAPLYGGAAQVRIRAAFALLVGFAALAAALGLEAILGAFAAGLTVSVLGGGAEAHPEFRAKLEAIGFGVLAPVFFVSSGLTFDVQALLTDPGGLVLVPMLTLAILAARGLPALLYRPLLSTRQAIAAGLLQATSLTFIVAAAMIGEAAGVITATTGTALVAAGIISVILFPPLASSLIRRENVEQGRSDPAANSTAEPA
jgi:Kef-type K+ transport system membrane component KefB